MTSNGTGILIIVISKESESCRTYYSRRSCSCSDIV